MRDGSAGIEDTVLIHQTLLHPLWNELRTEKFHSS